MPSSTKNAQFHYRIYDGDDSHNLTCIHPVPALLCSKSQAQDKRYHDTFREIFNAVNARTHNDVMAKVSHPCIKCGKPVKDTIKSPMVYLHLPEPIVIIMAMPSCAGQICDAQILNDMEGTIGQAYANGGIADGGAAGDGKGLPGSVGGYANCDVCGKPASKRCAGCGSALYCSRACQKSAWRNHKSLCSILKSKRPEASNDDVD